MVVVACNSGEDTLPHPTPKSFDQKNDVVYIPTYICDDDGGRGGNNVGYGGGVGSNDEDGH